MLPVGSTFRGGEDTEPGWEPVESDRVWPGLKLRVAEGEGELSAESSPELESDFRGGIGLGFRPETDPEELELLLVVVVVVVVVAAAVRVRRGETGEPRSSSRKSGLLAAQSASA